MIASSEFELSCCLAVGRSLYVGMDEVPRVARVCEDGRLDELKGFEQVQGRDQW